MFRCPKCKTETLAPLAEGREPVDDTVPPSRCTHCRGVWLPHGAVEQHVVPPSMDAGAVAYMILGQLGWFVRDKLSGVDPRRVPKAVDALFRADLDLKSSGGDPKVLLERLVVELCDRRV